MFSQTAKCNALLWLLPLSFGLAQNVVFEVVPTGGTPVTAGLNTVQVTPGTVLPFQVTSRVLADPVSPANAGLAGFDFDVVTDLGVAQTTPFAFDAGVSPLFTTGLNTGIPIGDDIIGIAAGQNVRANAPIQTNFALNQARALGVGQLLTPSFEGEFQVNLIARANVFATDLGNSIVPGLVAPTPGFTVITRFPESTTPIEPDEDEDQEPEPPPPLPDAGDGTGPELPDSGQAGGDDDEQVAGETPEPPTEPVVPCLCGFSAASTLAFTLIGLCLLKRRFV